MKQLKIGTSWVRGVVGEALTPELVVDFACAFGTWAAGEAVVIGRDTRRSSPMLRAAVIAGLQSPGCEVIDLGVATTPLISFAVRELGAAGGISITGSHNNAAWNALKFIGPDGALLNPVKGEELLDLYHARAFRKAPEDRFMRLGKDSGIQARYLEHLLAGLDAEAIRSRRFRLAVDFCNGAAGEVTDRFLRALECRVQRLNPEPADDEFAHSPAPSAASMKSLGRCVRETESDLGAALNIDGDRIGFVTGDGVPLSEEYTLPLAARQRLQRRAGSVVTNLSTSRMIDRVAAEHGQTVTRTAVGESFVVEKGVELDAVLAGEGSGGVTALPAGITFDSLMTLGMVLESLAEHDTALTAMVDHLPRLCIQKGEIPCLPDRAYRAVDSFRKAFADRNPNLSDGVRVDWDDAWMHVRVSSTEPLLRLIVEAEQPDRASGLFEELRELALEATHAVGGSDA